jgi:hypothetical protein
MKTLLVAALVALALPVAAEDTKFGAGVTLKEATPIASILAKPEDFVGKTIRVDGVATAVCTHMGCWMAVADEKDADKKDAPTVRLKVDDGVIVFPVTAKGKKVSAEGTFELATTEEAKEAAGEHAKHDPKAQKSYQLKASGAIVKN